MYADHQGNLNPSKIVASDGQNRLTYKDLILQSNKLARCLIQHKVTNKGSIILCMNRSVEYIIAMIGILKADAVYIPIEARTPKHRRNRIIRDCKPYAIICDNNTSQTILSDETSEIPPLLIVINTDKPPPQQKKAVILTKEHLNMFEESFPDYKNSEDDVACVLYTSGSTGDPKGVMITHRNIDEYIRWALEHIGIGENDRILCTAPFYFDMSLFDVYCSLRAGATMCIATERVLLFPKQLIEFAESENVTVWKGISSLLMYIVRTGAISSENLPTLRTIIFGGETLHSKYLIEWMRTFPKKTFYNVYGPTEATGVSLYYRVDNMPKTSDDCIPIGKPCENTEVFLLDDDNKPVPPGQIGELCIKSVCLAKGYLNDPQKTNQSFIDNPLNPGQGERIYKTGDNARRRKDGNYEFIGRRDAQVKFLGYRIELSDIEQALVSIDGVHDAGALLVESIRTGLNELIAYAEIDDEITIGNILSEVKNRLPHYMVPKRLYRIDYIPRTDRDKIDRFALLSYHKKKAIIE